MVASFLPLAPHNDCGVAKPLQCSVSSRTSSFVTDRQTGLSGPGALSFARFSLREFERFGGWCFGGVARIIVEQWAGMVYDGRVTLDEVCSEECPEPLHPTVECKQPNVSQQRFPTSSIMHEVWQELT